SSTGTTIRNKRGTFRFCLDSGEPFDCCIYLMVSQASNFLLSILLDYLSISRGFAVIHFKRYEGFRDHQDTATGIEQSERSNPFAFRLFSRTDSGKGHTRE